MFILSSISSNLEFWSVNDALVYESSELKVFKIKTFLGEIFDYWLNDLFGTNVDTALKSCWQSLLTILFWANTTSVISKWGVFSPFLSLVILL